MDARRSPERVLMREPTNQSPDFRLCDGSASPSGPTLAAPVQPPTEARPADDGIRLDDKQMAPPVAADPGQEDPQSAIRCPQPRSSGCSLQDFDLVSQGEVLEGQLVAGA